jgi:hypothetical protein
MEVWLNEFLTFARGWEFSGELYAPAALPRRNKQSGYSKGGEIFLLP